MKAEVLSRLSISQRRYNLELDKSGGQEPTFKVKDYVSMDHAKFAATVSDAADEMTNRQKNNLPHGGSVPYRVFIVPLHRVTIQKNVYQTLFPSAALRCPQHENSRQIIHMRRPIL